jgi:hypothetical protein
MPKTIAKFRCKECGDIFTATSDEYTFCKCGKCGVKPDHYSTQYKNDNNSGYYFERLDNDYENKIINDVTYYFESDFYIMKGEILDLYNEVKILAKELKFFVYESFREDDKENQYLEHISFSKREYINQYYEQNEIDFSIYFDKNNFPDRFETEYKERLTNFRDFLIKLKNKEINLSDRNTLKADENISWSREQLELYDYSFKF